jgi:hypothetical protein
MMRRLMLLCAWLCATVFVVAAKPALATGSNLHSYVSNAGLDSNGCANPTNDACATFPRALSQTANYGEIDCVNPSSNYDGSLIIEQSVTIDCAGGLGSFIGYITVNGPGIVVRLRNLSLNDQGYGYIGIDAQNMAALYLENCVIANYNAVNRASGPYIGIKFEPLANAQLSVTNTIISNNGYGGGITGGIYIVPDSGVTATVSINRSEINGNTFGIVGDGTSGGVVKGTISDSVVSGNGEDGVAAISSGSPVWLLVDQTKVAGNAFGLAAGGSGAEILARYSSVFDNTTGLHTSGGGTLYSYGTNSINGNSTNGAFTGTIGQQ